MPQEYTRPEMAQQAGAAKFAMPALLARILPNSRIWEFNRAALNFAVGTNKEFVVFPLRRWPGCWYWRELNYLTTERGVILTIADAPPPR